MDPLLNSVTADELLIELRSRSQEKESLLPPSASSLAHLSSSVLVKRLLDIQKVIYGVDDRLDLNQVTDDEILNDADSVLALVRASDIQDNGDGTSTLVTKEFGEAYGLCQSEPFRTQPIVAFCSGVLVANDIVATAGHCVSKNNVEDVRFVFGFRMKSSTQVSTSFPNSEIYSGAELLGREKDDAGADWSLVRLDRKVTGHRVAAIRRTGKIADTQSVHVIGHPCGLPAKYAAGANVRDNSHEAIFVANLDTYGGNSGSPVFNSETHEVEGLLVRGENDFVLKGDCRVSMVCPMDGCKGEACTRVSRFSAQVPEEVQ